MNYKSFLNNHFSLYQHLFLADLLFSPTKTGVDNLQKVGVTKNVYLTGDISLDLLFKNDQYISEQE